MMNDGERRNASEFGGKVEGEHRCASDRMVAAGLQGGRFSSVWT